MKMNTSAKSLDGICWMVCGEKWELVVGRTSECNDLHWERSRVVKSNFSVRFVK